METNVAFPEKFHLCNRWCLSVDFNSPFIMAFIGGFTLSPKLVFYIEKNPYSICRMICSAVISTRAQSIWL